MRLLIALSLAFVLSACGGTLSERYAAFVEKVRAKAEKVCGFQPTAQMVSNVAASLALDDKNAADVETVNQIVAKLCDVVKVKPE